MDIDGANTHMEKLKYDKMLNDLRNTILYKRRYRVEHPFLNSINDYKDICKKNINENTMLYRARICDEDFITESELDLYRICNMNCAFCFPQRCDKLPQKLPPFYGYDEKNSFIVTDRDKIGSGRANASYIPVLYVAESEYTAIAEVRPVNNSFVSVANIISIENLTIYDAVFESRKSEELDLFKLALHFAFSTVVTNHKDYILTQYISEYINELGFDGLRYRSSVDKKGCNLAIFAPYKCQAIGSKIHQIQEVKYIQECIYPPQKSQKNTY